jgi:fructokinase
VVQASFTIAAAGEALFDCYADGRRLPGGAPFNFGVQAHRLASRYGGRAVPVTRIGDDELGHEFLGLLDVPREGVQIDAVHPTGRVDVTIVDGEPHYEIARNVAWDFIEYHPLECDAICFGTLAQRSPKSRDSIQKLVANTPASALRLFDINLRQHFWNRDVIERGLELATAVKLNRHEMSVVSEMLRVDGPAELRTAFSLDAVVLTQGELGTSLYTREGVVVGDPVAYTPSQDADAVGAGDACAAAIAVGLVCQWPLDRVVNLANRIGAWVASQRGALPPLPEQIFDLHSANAKT